MMPRVLLLCLMVGVSWGLVSPSWAAEADNTAGARMERQYQNMTDELIGMMKETVGIIMHLDHAPTAEEKRQLAEIMQRLDAMQLKQQQAMQDIRDQLDTIRRQQDDFMDRQRLLKQQH